MNAKSGDNSWGCFLLGVLLTVLVCVLLRLIDGTVIEDTIAAWLRAAGF